jgi:hypothetical protein
VTLTPIKAALLGGLLLTGAALPLQAFAAAPPPPPLAVPSPVYSTIVMETDVARPAAQVWARVGKYCDISEWFGLACTISSGKDNDVGTVRVLNGSTIEILVAKTEFSYTYAQPVRVGQAYNMYHGTLEARPVTATTSKLIYTLIFDSSLLADDAARAADRQGRTTRFTGALKAMKTLAEGGTLPPPAPR